MVKNLPEMQEVTCNSGGLNSMLGLERSLGDRNGNPLQYSCLENPMERGAWGVYSLQGHKELDMTEHGMPRGTLETNTTM